MMWILPLSSVDPTVPATKPQGRSRAAGNIVVTHSRARVAANTLETVSAISTGSRDKR